MYTAFDCSFYRTTDVIEEIVPLLKKYGIQGICVPVSLLEDRGRREIANNIVEQCGLRWSLMPTPVDFYAEDVNDVLFSKSLETLDLWCDAAKRLGVDRAYNHIHPGSNSRQYDENFEWYANRIGKVYDVFRRYDMKYGLEFVGPVTLQNTFRYPFISALSGALALADSVSGEIGILFDTFHWYCGSGNMDDVYYLAFHIERLLVVHINDGVIGKTRLEQDDGQRAMPMTAGLIDAKGICDIFNKRGYDGPVLCEPMNPAYKRFEKMSPEEVVSILAESYHRVR